MNTPVKVVGFLVAVVAAFVLALGVGSAVGPVSGPPPAHEDGHGSSDEDSAHDPGANDDSTAPAKDAVPGGLMVSQDGYTLRLVESTARPGAGVPVRFTIEGPDGRPVTAYEVEHERRLHLIAVRRDFSGFQHVHPRLAADGTWSTGLALTAGQWRLFADFTAEGAEPLTLGADLAVAGDHRPPPEAAQARTAEVDGYTITLAGDLVPGADAELTLGVSRDGAPVTDLEPYLGAYGHLVALREGDLAYLHVHPDGTPGDDRTDPGPDVVFHAAVPSGGGYRLYLDFKHEGVVRTAEFAVDTEDQPEPPTLSEPPTEGDDDHADH